MSGAVALKRESRIRNTLGKLILLSFVLFYGKKNLAMGHSPRQRSSTKIHRIHNFTIVNGYWPQGLIRRS